MFPLAPTLLYVAHQVVQQQQASLLCTVCGRGLDAREAERSGATSGRCRDCQALAQVAGGRVAAAGAGHHLAELSFEGG